MDSAFAQTNPHSQREGRVAKAIEEQTAKLPSDTFLWIAVGAMTATHHAFQSPTG